MNQDRWSADGDEIFELPDAEGEMPRAVPLAEQTEEELMENLQGETPPEDVDAVIYVLERFLQVHPVSVRARLKLASLYASEYGDGVAGAERVLKDALAIKPDTVTAMVWLGLLQGHPHSSLTVEESLTLLERAVALSGDPHILRNYANKAWEAGQIERAVEAFERLKALTQDPNAEFFRRVADQSLNAIRQGEKPADFVYWYPEIC
jgi:lipopolysaccharide biosynthesis regulator YciM